MYEVSSQVDMNYIHKMDDKSNIAAKRRRFKNLSLVKTFQINEVFLSGIQNKSVKSATLDAGGRAARARINQTRSH